MRLYPVVDYYNPYCDGGAVIDSQPICQVCENPGGDVSQDGSGDGQDDPNAGNGDGSNDGSHNQGDSQGDSSDGNGTETTSFDLAFAAFKKGDHKLALKQINIAAKEYPNNGDVHQLRSLIHFGMKNYKSSAAAAHKALSGAAPWEWSDLKSSYSSTKAYTADLRSLESHVAKKPSDKAAQFLLAYQYLMMDHKDAARKRLKKVVELEPRDKLAASLLSAMDKSQG